jgi:hypothetical protein
MNADEHGLALRASVGSTNVASLRRNLLLLHELRIIAGYNIFRYACISNIQVDFEASEFRFADLVINCISFDYKTAILDVNLGPLMVSA